MVFHIKRFAITVAVALAASILAAPASQASGLLVSFPTGSHSYPPGAWSAVATVSGATPGVTGDASGSSIRATVRSTVSEDRLRLGDVSNVSAGPGLTLTDFDGDGSGLQEISIEGSVSDVNLSLQTLEFSPGTDATSSITISILDGVGLFFGGHYYEAVSSGLVWKDGGGWATSNPRTGAAALNNGTCTGYLTNITSAEENEVAKSLVPSGAYAAWIGGSDRGNTTDEWEWLDGPEAGTIFFKKSDATYNLNFYNNWGGVEPNNYRVGDGTTDDFIYILQDGTWADSTYGTYSSIVEYGDETCAPSSEAASASFDAVTMTAPSAPTAPQIAFNPSNGAVLSFSAPTSDGGSSITGYVIDYRIGSAWVSVTPVLLTGTVSGLDSASEITFRVAAVNSVGSSAYAMVSHRPPEPFTGPIASGLARKLLQESIETTVTFSGLRLDTVTSITVEDLDIKILEQSEYFITCLIPPLTVGTKDVTFRSTKGNVTHQDALFVVAAPSSPKTKLNAGSFKGFVAVYALGYEGHRLSAKVGNDWVVVPEIPASTNDLFRLLEFTGSNYLVNIKIYIDRDLLKTVNLVTR